ncbi:MAG: DUF952 domain-containing protein [Dehalococcoidia bacterium]
MLEARDSDHSPDDLTHHLVPAEYFRAQPEDTDFAPEAFAADGFIHCTDGAANLIQTANRYYRDDPRAFVALVIDKSKVQADIRYEDPARLYPHIYGPLNRDAIVRVVAMRRAADGTFEAFES